MTGAIVQALMESAWQGVAIAALLFVMLRVLPRDRPRMRYAAALGALVAMLGGFVMAFVDGARAPVAGVRPVAAGAAWPAWLWMAGVVGIGLYRAAGWVLLRHRVRRCTAPALELWEELVSGLRARMGVSRNVSVLRADWLQSPAVYGAWKPVILVPAAAVAGLPVNQLEAILAHELAHVMRWDFAVNMVQGMVETLLFHHPAAWWIGEQMRRERECCCDQMAAAAIGDRGTVARALVALEGRSLRNRIERLMGAQSSQAALGPAWRPVPTLLLLAIAAVAWQDVPDGPYGKWVTEDVVYIIHPEERNAFVRLQTDEERSRFVEQFWERRAEGVKKEHYRRIAYSNELFGTGGTKGWKTDRGKMYIVAGPPDEIFSWPTQGLDRWIYKAKDNKREERYEFRDGKLQPVPK